MGSEKSDKNKPSGRGVNHKRAFDAAEREKKLIQLLIAGATYQQISDKLGYGGIGNVHRAYQRAKARVVQQTLQEDIDRQASRLEALHLAWWTKRATTHGANVLLRIYQREADLKGLDAPRRTELTGRNGGPISMATVDIASLTDEQLERVAAGDLSPLTSAGGTGEAPEGEGGSDPEGT